MVWSPILAASNVLKQSIEDIVPYEKVAEENFITMTALCDLVNYQRGTLVPSNTWLKFFHQGKVLYIPQKPVRRNMSAKNIADAGLVGGGKVVVIGNRSYKVRLMYGAPGKEWDTLFYPLHITHPNGAAVVENFTDTDMGISGMGTFCEEVSAPNRLMRGYSTVTYAGYITQTNSDAGRAWRPVLERI